MRAIGIDLGTTNSVAAVCEGDRTRALTNQLHEILTPSVVTYHKRRGADGGEVVVGGNAVRNAMRDPANTIFSIKRLMGRQYGEPRVEEVQKRYGFQLAPPPAADLEDRGVRVLLNNEPKTPAEVSAIILGQIKADAERALGEKVTHAVITVPAYFEERQRYATNEAGKLAGLTVLEIVDEPTAAALAFGLGKEDEKHRVLVYDLGGGTFDISLIQMHKHHYEVLEIQGDNWLGGDDFDHMIVRRMFDWVKAEYSFDPTSRPELLMLAKPVAEAAKKALSVQQRAEILWQLKVPDLGMVDVEMEVTREQFESDIRGKLETTVDLVHQALKNQALSPSDITAVLLVGGSTAIPMVRTLLADVFAENKIRVDVNPMECVALGAAIRAARYSEAPGQEPDDTKGSIHRRTPMNLGINTVKGEDLDHFEVIIPKGTPYPLDEPRKTIVRPTEVNQKLLRLPVYEGLSEQASLNVPQGEIEIPLRKGLDLSDDIEISFDYDRNRVVTLTVRIVSTSEIFERRLEHNRQHPKPQGAAATAPSGDGAPANLSEDWPEDLSHIVKVGKMFRQGYGEYMTDDDRKDLETAIAAAEQALKTRDETEGKRQQLAIDNKLWGSGLASLMYIAESAMQRANARQAKVLAQGIAALRQAFAQGLPPDRFEKLVQDVRAVIGDIMSVTMGPEPPDPKMFRDRVRSRES